MFCFHKYELHSKAITKSIYESMKEHGFNPSQALPIDFKKQQIVVLKCKKCGNLKEKLFNESAII